MIVACGGWSKRKTLYGGDRWRDRQDDMLDPKTDAAKIRAFFIHPDWARQGIGTLLLDACESAARAAGFTRFEMGATLTGAKLFQQRGYVAMERLEVPLEGDITLPVIHMVKGRRSARQSQLAVAQRAEQVERFAVVKESLAVWSAATQRTM